MTRSLCSLAPRVLFALIVLIVAAAPVAAQHGDHDAHASHAAPKLEGELAEHFHGIDLNESQIRQIIEIQQRAHAQMDSLRRVTTDREAPAFKAALKELMDREHAAFKALLTPEQRMRFEENMKAHHAEEAKRPAPVTRPATMTSLGAR